MKHNWTRPIVKFIEDDLVASGIGGATGPARFFAARGAGLIGDQGNQHFGSGDTRTWSAWDNMFVQKTGAKRRRFFPSKKSRYVRRPMYRRALRRGRRTYGRKRSSWGTRVRRATLRAVESKRHQVTTTQELIDDQVLDTTAICRVPDLNQGSSGVEGFQSKITRNGQSIITTGIASHIHLANQTTQPMLVDLIWYYKKRDVTELQRIYKGTQYEENAVISDPTSYFARMILSVGNMNTVILKRVRVLLSEKGEPNDGRDTKMLKYWLPFKKVMRFNGVTEGTTNQDYDIHFGVVPHNKEGTAFTTGGGAGDENVLLAQHRHVLYYRDP